GLATQARKVRAASALSVAAFIPMPISVWSEIFANALPGFFPLSSAPVDISDPLAAEFVSWRAECESTIRSTYQILSRGTPNLENETWGASVAAIKGTSTPEELGQELQDGLASWYEPQQ
ncbi:MAG: sugar ABC transporter substrate-binding protein, partial [Pseudomonadota bacterium]